MSIDRCNICRFWYPVSEGEIGRCRRHAPRVLDAALTIVFEQHGGIRANDDMAETATIYPVTFETSWCGEFELSPTADTADMGRPFMPGSPSDPDALTGCADDQLWATFAAEEIGRVLDNVDAPPEPSEKLINLMREGK